MQRRTALATAGAITLTLSTAALAGAASLGLLDIASERGTKIGRVTPVDVVSPTSTTAAPQVETVYVDDLPTASTAPAATDPPTSSRPAERGDDQDGHDDPPALTTAPPAGSNITAAPPSDDHHESEPESDDDD